MAQKMSGGDRLVAVLEGMAAQLKKNSWAARVVAFIADYLLCGMLSFLPATLIYQLLRGEGTFTGLADFVAAGHGMGVVVAVFVWSLAMTYAYYVLVPLKLMAGQTPGKRMVHLEVVMLNGNPASLSALSLRWAVMTFVETLATIGSAYVAQLFALLSPGSLSTSFSACGMVISVVSALYAWRNKEHRAFHDIIAGTWVYHDRG